MRLFPPTLATHKRGLSFALLGLVATAGIGALRQDALASWIRPAHGSAQPSGPWTRVTASPDGRWVAVESSQGVGQRRNVRVVEVATGTSRALPFEDASCLPNAWSTDGLLRVHTETTGPIVVWIDPRTLATVRTTPDHDWIEQGLADASHDGWSIRSRGRGDDGKPCNSMLWTKDGRELCFSASPLHELQTAREPGIVFESVSTSDATVVLRHEMESGATRELVRLERWQHADVSPDGQRLLVIDAHSRAARTGRERARVLDARDGTQLGEFEAPQGCRWTGDGHRWIQVERDGHVIVRDCEHDTVIDLGTGDVRTRVEPLPDDTLLVQNDGDVALHATTGALLRRL